jgi:HipA-like protein
MKVVVFEELRKTKIIVGALYREKGAFYFTYERDYLDRQLATSLGPDLPLGVKPIRSKHFFQSLQDLLPDKNNPAYASYSKKTGVAVDETDVLKLLISVGKRGPSKFVFEEYPDDILPTAEKLRQFREKLQLSQRDFSLLFDIPLISMQQLEKKEGVQKPTRMFLQLMMDNHKLLKEQIRKRGYLLHQEKLKMLIQSFGFQERRDYNNSIKSLKIYIKSEIEHLRLLESNLIHQDITSTSQNNSIRHLISNQTIVVAGVLNELIAILRDILYHELPPTKEMEQFSQDYNQTLKEMRNLIAHGLWVDKFKVRKGIKNSSTDQRVKRILTDVETYFNKTKVSVFLGMMEKILEQLESANLAH